MCQIGFSTFSFFFLVFFSKYLDLQQYFFTFQFILKLSSSEWATWDIKTVHLCYSYWIIFRLHFVCLNCASMKASSLELKEQLIRISRFYKIYSVSAVFIFFFVNLYNAFFLCQIILQATIFPDLINTSKLNCFVDFNKMSCKCNSIMFTYFLLLFHLLFIWFFLSFFVAYVIHNSFSIIF